MTSLTTVEVCGRAGRRGGGKRSRDDRRYVLSWSSGRDGLFVQSDHIGLMSGRRTTRLDLVFPGRGPEQGSNGGCAEQTATRGGLLVADGLGLLAGVVAVGSLELLDEGDVLGLGLLGGGAVVDLLLPGVLLGLALRVGVRRSAGGGPRVSEGKEEGRQCAPSGRTCRGRGRRRCPRRWRPCTGLPRRMRS